MEQQLAETDQRNPNLKRSRNTHIRTVKSIDQQNRRMKDYPTKLGELERRIQAARRREAATMLMDKWGWPICKGLCNDFRVMASRINYSRLYFSGCDAIGATGFRFQQLALFPTTFNSPIGLHITTKSIYQF